MHFHGNDIRPALQKTSIDRCGIKVRPLIGRQGIGQCSGVRPHRSLRHIAAHYFRAIQIDHSPIITEQFEMQASPRQRVGHSEAPPEVCRDSCRVIVDYGCLITVSKSELRSA